MMFSHYLFYCHAEIVPYVDIIYDGENHPHPVLPPIGELATENEVYIFKLHRKISSLSDINEI